MTAPDLAAIIARSIQVDVYREAEMVRDILAAKVPALCQTCGGTKWLDRCDGSLDTYGECLGSHPCPDCPTIDALLAEATEARQLAQQHGVTPAKLLAIGAAVMTWPHDEPFAEWRELLRILRAVQP